MKKQLEYLQCCQPDPKHKSFETNKEQQQEASQWSIGSAHIQHELLFSKGFESILYNLFQLHKWK